MNGPQKLAYALKRGRTSHPMSYSRMVAGKNSYLKMITCTQKTTVDLVVGQCPSPLFLDQTEARRAKKLFIVYCHFCHTHKIEKLKKKIRQGSPRKPIRLMNRTTF